MHCPGCDRRFETGAEFCYHDGVKLVADSEEKVDQAPAFTVCDECGWEGGGDRELCPRDGRELTLVDPSRKDRRSPSIPLLVCPECGEYAPPGVARCPQDESLLTPLEYPHARALPVDGAGPRRKICRECGRRYGDAADYCSDDGHRLKSLN